ncbi:MULTISPECIES: hypothetical protein [Pseudonocardia]|uniref:Uncharacterized protein n=2 Tax=Pseudonocardia TaxID=1847 RepID=A0A1Y2N2U6_PSEAH|nr:MULTISPECIES: hypothetical protein [Pseudonocardia]OSY41511.1 hypothetical protein BG845_02002 [Pseudonocardia autotrophica]TDN71466.1 hypothetical protein C8E95_0498 [Pseudonocardia autotrophica]BBG02142.1 hypothetical protein Pdca_33510 [Pseudonocardia autotrophica]GEC24156.1 hypothetical protein PSA01_11850 [Pseudonocardia saturnea]
MVSISVSARSLAAARLIDPDVNTAAVQAAVEAALAAERQEKKREADRPAARREHTAGREPDRRTD